MAVQMGSGMLTQNFAFGFNILSLAGLLLMGFSLTLNRQKRVGTRVSFALMAAGTGLLLIGFYAGGALTR